MGRVNNFVKWFLYITTGILIVYAINVTISGDDTVSVKSLWNLLLSGFLTALITEFFIVFMESRESDKKGSMLINFFIHYAILCIVMIVCGNWFGWVSLNPSGIFMMMVSVAGVYLMACIFYYIIDMKQADEINKKLKEKYGDK